MFLSALQPWSFGELFFRFLGVGKLVLARPLLATYALTRQRLWRGWGLVPQADLWASWKGQFYISFLGMQRYDHQCLPSPLYFGIRRPNLFKHAKIKIQNKNTTKRKGEERILSYAPFIIKNLFFFLWKSRESLLYLQKLILFPDTET